MIPVTDPDREASVGTPTRLAARIVAVVLLVLLTAGGATFYTKPLWVNDEIIRLKMWRQNVRSEYVDVDGYNIHYLEAAPPAAQGETDGIPLILIHGIGSRGEDWSPMIPTLAAEGFHVYVPDLLGYGRSEQPDVDYSIPLEEDIILKFMDTLQLEHADVAGWSMGGWIALRLTLDHPEMVDRLVIYDSAGVYFPPTFDASLFVPEDATGLERLRHILSPIKRPPFPSFIARAAIHQLQSNGWVIRRSFAAMVNGKDLMDFVLHDIQRPTLVVWGSDDQLIPLSVGEEMHKAIAGSQLAVIDGCGHLAPAECPKPVLKVTLQFLQPAAASAP